MAAQTLVYLYNQRQYVVLLERTASPTRRYETVYAKDLILNRGVDNLLEFALINQEQKPVDISNKTITARILSYDGKTLLIQKSCEPIFPLTGITSLRISAAELEHIDDQLCYYSLEIPVQQFDYPVFVDSSGGARGVIRIVDSVLPSFVASREITIPSHPKPSPTESKTYYSSVFYTNVGNFYTLQIATDRFTGSTQIQGSTLIDFSTYYNIDSESSFTDHTGSRVYNVNGFHPYLRVQINNTGTPQSSTSTTVVGDVSSIYIR